MNTGDYTEIQYHRKKKYPTYGIVGIALILISEILLFLRVYFIGIYFTPIVWTGYILFIDALNLKLSGRSIIINHRREFLFMLPWSIACWLIFEVYNLQLRNWTYTGLPKNVILRFIGYGWSFATIFPAILETAELFKYIFQHSNRTSSPISKQVLISAMLLGVCFLVMPLLLDQSIAAKLFVLVWMGFIFVLDPINNLHGEKSIFGEWKLKDYTTSIALVLSGLFCGVLWEFWNYWAIAKWQYIVPISFVGPKFFEMPLLGYLGFVPFAFEVYVMQEFLISLFPSLRR
jgi:hypothetical protein